MAKQKKPKKTLADKFWEIFDHAELWESSNDVTLVFDDKCAPRSRP